MHAVAYWWGTHLGQFLAVVVAHDGVGDAHAVEVAVHGPQALLAELVGEDAARVAHQRRQVRSLPPRGGCHIHH